MLTLRRAEENDCPTIHQIQVRSFSPLLTVYRDFQSSPAAESVDQVRRRFAQPFTDYYLIFLETHPVGILRVCNFGEECRLSPICILPEHQGMGYAQEAMILVEKLYPKARRWTLDTILQEPKLCHLYEKMGYRRTGKYEHIQDGMDLVFYRKDVELHA